MLGRTRRRRGLASPCVMTTPAASARLWMIAPAHVPRLHARPDLKGTTWHYMGTDVQQRRRTAHALGSTPLVGFGNELNRVAHDIRQPFLEWIAEAGACQPDPTVWWGSTLASKSPLQTDLFLLVCYAELIRSWLSETPGTTRRIVVVENPWLAWLLRCHLAGETRIVFWRVGWWPCVRDAAGWLVRLPLATMRVILWAVKSLVVVRWTFRGSTDPLDGRSPRAVLIYTWIHPRSLVRPGHLTDPWTGRLQEILTTQGERVKRLTPLQIPSTLMEPLRALAPQLIVTARYLTVGDLLRGACRWLWLHDLARWSRFQDWNYAALLYQEWLREWGQVQFAQTRLFYLAMRRIARCYGAKVKCLIYPFENQPWEKLLCLAWREQAPQVTLVGYQHSWVPPLLLSYALGAREGKTVPLPDYIVTNSDVNLRTLRAGGYPEEKLVNGGALRHEYLHTAYNDAPPPADPVTLPLARPRRIVFVTLPLHEAHASRLLTDVLEEFQAPLMIAGLTEPVQFLVKLHPSLPLRRFSHRPLRLPPWIALSDQPTPQALAQADLLLYGGPTSTWWEAALSGVPVLKYASDLLDIDAGHGNGLTVRVCTRETLRASLQELLRERAVRRPAPAHLINEFFGKVNEAVWTTLTGVGSTR